MSTLRGKKLKLHKSCMEGTCSDILQVIETEVKNAGGYNVIWIRESPGVKKSALAASISTQLQNQNRHVSKIIWDFPRLLKSVGTSRVGEEEGICIIHFYYSYNSYDIQSLFTPTYIVKLFHTVMKNCIWGYIFVRDYVEAKTICIEGHWWM